MSLIICNGNYDNVDGYANLDAAIPDGKLIRDHWMNNTFFNQNIKFFTDLDIEEISEIWSQLREEVRHIVDTDPKARVAINIFYSGHGCVIKGTKLLTQIVLNDGKMFPLEEKLRQLSRIKNTFVISTLDCCRVEEEPIMKTRTISSSSTADFGQLLILFSCKIGNTAIIR
jgi:hypothetical protein